MSKTFSVTCVRKMSSYIGAFFLMVFFALEHKSMVFAMDFKEDNARIRSLAHETRSSNDANEILVDLEHLLKKANLDDIHSLNKKGQTALHIAALHGAELILSDLLTSKTVEWDGNPIGNLKTKIDIQDRFHDTALHLAIRAHRLNAARVLIEAGASLGIRDILGRHLLHAATSSIEHEGFLKFLIQNWKNAKLDIDALDHNDSHPGLTYNRTALIEAARFENMPAAKVLIEAGAQINKTDMYGLDALKYAICDGRGSVCCENQEFIQFFIQEYKKGGLAY